VTIKYRCRRNPHEPLSYLPPPHPSVAVHIVIHKSFTHRGRIGQYKQLIGGVMVGGRGQMAKFRLNFATNGKKRREKILKVYFPKMCCKY